ncbi:MAG: hypothetical protein K6G08_03520 [Prevotella sp.]|nr:hypothetical protein [Prevotella sp.]
MKKNLLKSLLAVVLLSLGSMYASAQNEEGTGLVKMTVVDWNNQDSIYGVLDTISVGFNKAPAVGSAIAFGNTNWGVNKFGIAKADVSAIPGVVQKATLKMKVSGADNKRTTGWGVALTDNKWADNLSYTIAGGWTVSALLNGGNQVWSTTKSMTEFNDVELDVTEAFSAGQALATFIIYQTNAGVCYMTEPELEVEYEPYEATSKKFDFEDDVNIFTDDSRITSAIEQNEALGSKVIGWTCSDRAQNGYSFSHYDFTSLLNKPALVKVEFDYYNTKGARAILNIGDAQVRGTTGGSSKTTYNKTGVIFQIGSDKNNAFINGVTYGQDDKVNTYKIFNEELQDSVEVTETVPGLCNKWMHVTVIINNEARTVTWVVDDQDGDNLYFGSEPFYADDANQASQIDLFGYINNSHCAMLDNLEITNYKSNAVFADYTIKYVDANGNEIKDSRSGNGQVGKFVKLLDSDKAAIVADIAEGGINGKMKYLYDSDDSETVAIAEENTVISVKFRNAEIYAGVLNCMIDGQSGAAARLNSFSGFKFFEGDNYYVYPSRAYGQEGKYYFTPATSYNGVSFAFPGSLNSRTVSGVVTYIGQLNYAAVDSVAYYSDFERLALPVEDAGNGTGLGQLVGTVNSWYSFSGGIFDRFSQGRGIRLDSRSYVYTEPIAEAATYKVTIYGRNDVSSGDANPYALGLLVDGKEEPMIYDGLTIPEWGSAATGSSVVENVAIPAGGKLVIMNTNWDSTSKISLDDISLTKTGDYVDPNLVTGISISEVVARPAGVIYNLAGQVVKNAQKGLFIRDGKKVVIK